MSSLIPQASLFDAPNSSPIEAAVNWITGVLLGELAVGLCVLAVALVGFLMMQGRLPMRTGLRVTVGCFIMLGAPTIANGLAATWGADMPQPGPIPPDPPPSRNPPPANYDPYAGASVRTDR